MEGVEDNHEAEHGNLVDEFSRINLDNHSLIQTETSQVGRQKNLCSTLSTIWNIYRVTHKVVE